MVLDHKLPLKRDYIKDYLPHRDPMLFVDRVVSLTETSITIESDVQGDAEFFKGHFPQMPIMPCLLYTSPSPRDATLSRMPSSA